MVKLLVSAVALIGCASLAKAETLVQVGTNASGAVLYLDRDSMRTSRAIAGQRGFDVIQIAATYDLQGVRRDPGRTERALYSFDCARRTSNTLFYQKLRADGSRLYDWRAADFDFKYEPVKPGSLTEQAMSFVCSGGKLPVPVTDLGGLVPVNDDGD
jgi:opacity protein-like surface antigen